MRAKTTHAFTLTELLVVICLIALLASLILPPLSRTRSKSERITCVNNQKQIGVAYRIWAGDNRDIYPAEMAGTNGGWADFVKLTNAGPYCWSNYSLMADDLGQSTKVLVCPDDERKPANNFRDFGNKNISYFIGPGADEDHPLSILGGDRNLAPGLTPKNDFGYSPDDGSGNDVILQTNSPICWSLTMHSRGNATGAGNILMGDGSVQQCSSARLRSDYQCNAIDAGNYPTGYINKSNSFRLVFP